ncbi:hypothetical protein ACOMHN_066931 [Nucella lapillus]
MAGSPSGAALSWPAVHYGWVSIWGCPLLACGPLQPSPQMMWSITAVTTDDVVHYSRHHMMWSITAVITDDVVYYSRHNT